MSKDNFLNASVPVLLEQLELDEKIKLLTAPNWWNTNEIERLGIPPIRMSDGPNGVRGSSYFHPTLAQCIPCATSLGATFDTELAREVGQFLADESKSKSSCILLAPTVNIQRTPLGGRAYESFSEDPHLSGSFAAAIVDGVQSKGVAACIKHFVGNDQESERYAADSVMSERALREIYLMPFMLAQRDAQPWAYMTSYGRIEGVHCSESPKLLRDILRKEWGFDGIVMSDWYGTYGVDESMNAGMDLEMPGPPRWRTPLLVSHCISAQKVSIKTIDALAGRMLAFVQKLARKNPEVVWGDGVERLRDTPEGRGFCRRIAAEGITLLKNEGGVLPLQKGKVKTVAVVGSHAKGKIISGGGSAALEASYVVTPWEGLVANVPEGVELKYALGCEAHKHLPMLDKYMTTKDGKPGWTCTIFNRDENEQPGEVLLTSVVKNTLIKFSDFLPSGLTHTWGITLKGDLTTDYTGRYELGLAVAGRAKLYANGKMIVDNWTQQRNGDFLYSVGTAEERAVIDVEAGKPVEVMIEYINTRSENAPKGLTERRTAQLGIMLGVRFGGCPKVEADEAMEEAVKLASECDAVVVVGGLTPEWECEGFDRPTMHLPGRQDELISKVAKANPNTIVCLQSGSAVSLPWLESVKGLVQCWYSGNEAGNAIADVLYGTVNPSGRMPLTFPVRIEDSPAYPNLASENGKIHYREDLFVGYKHFQNKGIRPHFAFGYGLSYTTFSVTDLTVKTASTSDASFALEVGVKVTNTGAVTGSETVQAYVQLPDDIGVTTPRLQLRGFAKARDLAPGESRTVTIRMGKYAVSFWDTPINAWSARKGTYVVHVGTSSDDLPLQSTFEVAQTFEWSGI
ncbi:glycoside hydrolase family 3 protein [Coniophora puteana RWD-64-598 SS2]|uniref:beta-glucosidase n=1 Tax=Coniophora puteana (strain RWD-64-598) TaxID=741705 RepID=A0A5M3MKL5_CONPW|nr:glycoside hydrolase family 3 protein [Coniophora puteana RWD-64-598 SS2]EIW79091.1 glycoside hydrolase family 3 protein [Coniophora puteana RWD-64-598 SS2]